MQFGNDFLILDLGGSGKGYDIYELYWRTAGWQEP